MSLTDMPGIEFQEFTSRKALKAYFGRSDEYARQRKARP